MHDDQIRITIDQAIALVNDQLPSLRGLDIVAVDGGGTVNAIFRVGGSVGVRFPLRSADPDEVRSYLEHEALAIAEFARASPFPAPTALVHRGSWTRVPAAVVRPDMAGGRPGHFEVP